MYDLKLSEFLNRFVMKKYLEKLKASKYSTPARNSKEYKKTLSQYNDYLTITVPFIVEFFKEKENLDVVCMSIPEDGKIPV
jgi:hypothetical protein